MLRENVVKYIKGLNESERNKLIVMLKRGISCCVGLAKDLNVDPDDYNAELRRILL